MDLELERVGVDERQRREGVRGDDGIGAAEERAAGLDHDVGRGRRELRPDRHARDVLDGLSDDREELGILADVAAHVLAVHVRA